MASNAPAPAPASPLASMHALSPIVSLHKPDAVPDPSAPKLIAVFSWMGAQDAHIAKYTARYQALFPASPILLVRCPLEYTVLSGRARREIQPAVSAFRSLFPEAGGEGNGEGEGEGKDEANKKGEGEEEPEMILHLFSNGGCIMFQHFIDTLREEDAQGKKAAKLPPHACAMDSCPGSFDWSRAYKAVSASLPTWLSPLAHLLIAAQVLMSFFVDPMGAEGGRWGGALNEGDVLGKQVRRVYAFGDGDEMVDTKDVVRHAGEAREMGLGGGGDGDGETVRLENFGESRHVAHARTDGERYWGAVKWAWEGS